MLICYSMGMISLRSLRLKKLCFVGRGCLDYAIAPLDMTELRENALNKQSTFSVSCLLPPASVINH